MTEYTKEKCTNCDQMLRIPKDKGGITMVCPSCGNKIHSDFKFGGMSPETNKNIFLILFEMPSRVVGYIGKIFGGRS